jgi:DNA end-binding protein Ku
MAQATWKGSIQFGLVVIPVALYPATESHAGPVLHRYHARDASRIRMRRICEAEDTEVPIEEVASGYEAPDGTPVLLTPEDLAELPVPSKHVIDVLAFIDETDLDPLRLSTPYYLGLAGAMPPKPYQLLRDAL